MRRVGIAAVKTMMLQAASQRGILTEDRLQSALKPGADLHQVRSASYCQGCQPLTRIFAAKHVLEPSTMSWALPGRVGSWIGVKVNP